jgi:hypothetical protein
MTEGDTAFGEVVRRQFKGDFVAGKDANAIAAEATREVSENNAVMFEFDAEKTAGKFF